MPTNENAGTGSAVITKGSSMEEYLLLLVGPTMDCWMLGLLMEGGVRWIWWSGLRDER